VEIFSTELKKGGDAQKGEETHKGAYTKKERRKSLSKRRSIRRTGGVWKKKNRSAVWSPGGDGGPTIKQT